MADNQMSRNGELKRSVKRCETRLKILDTLSCRACLVEGLDLGLEARDLLAEGLAAGGHLLDARLAHRDGVLRGLLLLLALREVLVAEVLLGVVVGLLVAEDLAPQPRMH